MVVGFVNSGIMKLEQAVGVIMGANIGTTVTSWMLSLTGIESDNFFMQLLKPTSFSPILALIGVILIMFVKSEKKHDIGAIMIGFAILMFGMEMMSGAVEPLAGCAGVYQHPYHVLQSNLRFDRRYGPYRGDPEFIGICRYLTGTLRDRIGQFRDSWLPTSWVRTRYLCNGDDLIDRSKEECKACRPGTSVF